jgi:hypothetical protein
VLSLSASSELAVVGLSSLFMLMSLLSLPGLASGVSACAAVFLVVWPVSSGERWLTVRLVRSTMVGAAGVPVKTGCGGRGGRREAAAWSPVGKAL